MSEEAYALLPIGECVIHPAARIRFDYDVDELAESMKAMGQVQPGRAIDTGIHGAGSRYLVYIGCRRLLACKKSGIRHFKAIVVRTIDDNGRLQRELLAENMKRTNLSVLEELNLLANYSKADYSLDELAAEIGLSPKLVRARVRVARLLQEKDLIQTLYRIERISGFAFSHKHVEKITTMEEEKWLPIAIQAAELNWKSEDIESLGTQFSVESLIGTMPTWGHQFVKPNGQLSDATGRGDKNPVLASTVSSPTMRSSTSSENVLKRQAGVESPTRYQTITNEAQFFICPKCGSESVMELPQFAPVIVLKLGKTGNAGNAIAIGKESVSLQMAMTMLKCTNDSCGRELTMILDQSGEGLILAGKKEVLALVGKGREPEDSGRGALVWDEKEEMWLKCETQGGDSKYRGYDEHAKKWVIPVKIGGSGT